VNPSRCIAFRQVRTAERAKPCTAGVETPATAVEPFIDESQLVERMRFRDTALSAPLPSIAFCPRLRIQSPVNAWLN
jgi:hypothetical protein